MTARDGRPQPRPAGSRIPKWAAALLTLAILAGTLWPGVPPTEPISAWCVICGTRGLADALLNLLLFAPFGATLALWLGNWRSAVVGAMLFSGAIELAQIAVPGRYPVAGDVVFNTLGAGLGAAAALTARRWLRPAPAARRRLGVGASLAAAGALLLTGWLLQPSFPVAAYYGQWTPDLGHLEAYGGEVLEASIDGVPAPVGRLADSGEVRRRLLAGAPVRFTFRPGPLPPALAPILSVYDERQREIVLYGLDDHDLVLRYRSRAVAARLDQPDLRIRGGALALPAAPRDTSAVGVAFEAASPAGAACVQLDGRERGCLQHTLGRGWALLLHPERLARRFGGVLDIAWIVLLTLPIGWWGRRPGPTLLLALPAIVVSVAVPAALPYVGYAARVTQAALLGPALGVLLGAARTRSAARPRR